MQTFKKNCQLITTEDFGRHVIATVDIRPGEVILEENPLLVTNDADPEEMRCSNCFQIFQQQQLCSKCHTFPLCPNCTNHDQFDCEFLCNVRKKISMGNNNDYVGLFAPLKMLLMLENPQKAQQIGVIFERKIVHWRSEAWNERLTNVIEPIVNSGICEFFTNIKVDGDFLQTLLIHLDELSFDINNQTNSVEEPLRGIYLHASALSHNCLPNTVLSVDDKFHMKIYASVPIKQGEIICHSYANPLMGTSQRQHFLKITKHIECACTRCLDPTELGTQMSSIKCKDCTDGFAIASQQQAAIWRCQKCSKEIQATQIYKLLAEVGEEMVTAAGDVHIYEMLLTKYANSFHPNHFLIIDIKQNIAAILQAIMEVEPSDKSTENGKSLFKKMLKRKFQIREEILPVIRAVLHGISRPYAIALCEYFFTFLQLAEIELKDKEISIEEYLNRLRRAKDIAEEVTNILAHEPRNSTGGRMRENMRLQKQLIQEEIQNKKRK